MTNEEQKQALIGLCRIEIRRWEAAAEAVPDKKYMVELMQIALAALTAPPIVKPYLPDDCDRTESGVEDIIGYLLTRDSYACPEDADGEPVRRYRITAHIEAEQID